MPYVLGWGWRRCFGETNPWVVFCTGFRERQQATTMMTLEVCVNVGGYQRGQMLCTTESMSNYVDHWFQEKNAAGGGQCLGGGIVW